MWVRFHIRGVKFTKGGSLTVGGGDHDLNFQRLYIMPLMEHMEIQKMDMGGERLKVHDLKATALFHLLTTLSIEPLVAFKY